MPAVDLAQNEVSHLITYRNQAYLINCNGASDHPLKFQGKGRIIPGEIIRNEL